MKITYPEVGTPEYTINEKLSYEDARIIGNHIAALTAENAKLRELVGMYDALMNELQFPVSMIYKVKELQDARALLEAK